MRLKGGGPTSPRENKSRVGVGEGWSGNEEDNGFWWRGRSAMEGDGREGKKPRRLPQREERVPTEGRKSSHRGES